MIMLTNKNLYLIVLGLVLVYCIFYGDCGQLFEGFSDEEISKLEAKITKAKKAIETYQGYLDKYPNNEKLSVKLNSLIAQQKKIITVAEEELVAKQSVHVTSESDSFVTSESDSFGDQLNSTFQELRGSICNTSEDKEWVGLAIVLGILNSFKSIKVCKKQGPKTKQQYKNAFNKEIDDQKELLAKKKRELDKQFALFNNSTQFRDIPIKDEINRALRGNTYMEKVLILFKNSVDMLVDIIQQICFIERSPRVSKHELQKTWAKKLGEKFCEVPIDLTNNMINSVVNIVHQSSQDLPEPNEKHYWQCFKNISVPVRMNQDGDVECMSKDGKNCMWDGKCETKLKTIVRNQDPLTCGAMHKDLYGSIGYDNPSHWCAKGKKLLTQDSLQPGANPSYTIDSGVCRDSGGFYPNWSGYKNTSFNSCQTNCNDNPNCQGFAMHSNGTYCQLFGIDGKNVGSKPSTTITQGHQSQPDYTCNIKN